MLRHIQNIEDENIDNEDYLDINVSGASNMIQLPNKIGIELNVHPSKQSCDSSKVVSENNIDGNKTKLKGQNNFFFTSKESVNIVSNNNLKAVQKPLPLKKPLIIFDKIVVPNKTTKKQGQVNDNYKKYIAQNIKKKYMNTKELYNTKIINDIVYNENVHIVAVFKEYLIFDDITELFAKVYKYSELKQKLNRLYSFYEKYSKVFPSYIILEARKFMFKNISRKQRAIDEQQESDSETTEKDNISNAIFTSMFIKELMKREDCFDRNIIEEPRNILISYMKEKPRGDINSTIDISEIPLKDLLEKFVLKDSIIEMNASNITAHISIDQINLSNKRISKKKFIKAASKSTKSIHPSKKMEPKSIYPNQIIPTKPTRRVQSSHPRKTEEFNNNIKESSTKSKLINRKYSPAKTSPLSNIKKEIRIPLKAKTPVLIPRSSSTVVKDNKLNLEYNMQANIRRGTVIDPISKNTFTESTKNINVMRTESLQRNCVMVKKSITEKARSNSAKPLKDNIKIPPKGITMKGIPKFPPSAKQIKPIINKLPQKELMIIRPMSTMSNPNNCITNNIDNRKIETDIKQICKEIKPRKLWALDKREGKKFKSEYLNSLNSKRTNNAGINVKNTINSKSNQVLKSTGDSSRKTVSNSNMKSSEPLEIRKINSGVTNPRLKRVRGKPILPNQRKH